MTNAFTNRLNSEQSYPTSSTQNFDKELFSKLHRNHTPKKRAGLIKFAIGKQLSATLDKHDWNRNQWLKALRMKQKKRLSIRSERRETLYALSYELINYADYCIDSDYLFEVMTNVETLAKNIRQLHIYPSGRKTYDPVLRALIMLEQAGLIIILREMDHETKQRKAMRIWLKPEFFYSLGYTQTKLRLLVKNLHKYRVKKGVLDKAKNLYKNHVLRLKYSNVADISDKFALKNLLLNIKKTFLSEDVSKVLAKVKVCNSKTMKPYESSFEYDISPISEEQRERNIKHIQMLKEILNNRVNLKAKSPG